MRFALVSAVWGLYVTWLVTALPSDTFQSRFIDDAQPKEERTPWGSFDAFLANPVFPEKWTHFQLRSQPEEHGPFVSWPKHRFAATERNLSSSLQVQVRVSPMSGQIVSLHLDFPPHGRNATDDVIRALPLDSIAAPSLKDEKAQIELTEDGMPIKKEPEKGFFAKYWMYIVPFLVIMMMSGGGQEGEQQAAQK